MTLLSVNCLESLHDPNVSTVIATQVTLLPILYYLTDQLFEFCCVTLAASENISDAAGNTDMEICDMLHQSDFSFHTVKEWPKVSPFADCGVPLVADGEIATAAKVGAIILGSPI
jgi:hypothetical protein